MIRSDEIQELAAALAKAQGEIRPPHKNKTVTVKTTQGGSYGFDYADLGAVIDAIREPLAKNGLSYTHVIEGVNQGLALVTYLLHSSGQFIASVYPLPDQRDPKTFGGALTYGKRYSLSALVGVAADDDADAEPDNVAEFKDRAPKAPAPGAPAVAARPPVQPGKTVTEPQIKRLFAIAHGRGVTEEHIRARIKRDYKLDHIHDLNRVQYDEVCGALEKLPLSQGSAPMREPGDDSFDNAP